MRTYKGGMEDLVTKVKGILGDNVEMYKKTLILLHNLKPVVRMSSVARRKPNGLFGFNKGAMIGQGEFVGVKCVMLHKANNGRNAKRTFGFNTFGFRLEGFVEHVIKNADSMRYDFKHPVVDVMARSGQSVVDDNGVIKVESVDVADMLIAETHNHQNIILHNVAVKVNGAKVRATYDKNMRRTKKSKSFFDSTNTAITQVLTNPQLVG